GRRRGTARRDPGGQPPAGDGNHRRARRAQPGRACRAPAGRQLARALARGGPGRRDGHSHVHRAGTRSRGRRPRHSQRTQGRDSRRPALGLTREGRPRTSGTRERLLEWPVVRVVLSRSQPRPAAVTPALIRAVADGSPAHRAGVEAGWELLSVNDVVIPDVLAYRRELTGGVAELEVRAPDGRTGRFKVEWEEPGIEFEEVIFDGIRLCANHCDFCYIHQMPKGMRKSLYIMDDDYRTSFLYGSFVTLTNLTEGDVQRIIDEQLSPLYVS